MDTSRARAGHRALPDRGALPVEGRLPELDGATEWLNSPPLTAAGLRGQVVLVEFWTYTCINWLRTMPWVRGWAERYAPVEITFLDAGVEAFVVTFG